MSFALHAMPRASLSSVAVSAALIPACSISDSIANSIADPVAETPVERAVHLLREMRAAAQEG